MTQTNEPEAAQHPVVQQTEEQIAALATDGEHASAREQKARDAFQAVCVQASQVLSMPPNTPAGQMLQQALMAAFQWGIEASDASATVAQRREEVVAMQQLAAMQKSSLLATHARLVKEAAESAEKLVILGRIAEASEGMLKLTEKQVAMLEHASHQDPGKAGNGEGQARVA